MTIAATVCLLAFSFGDEPRVNEHSQVIGEFQEQVTKYVKLHDQAAAKLPRLKPTDLVDVITNHEKNLAESIRQLRPNAKQGDIFTPSVVTEFRRLVKIASHGSKSTSIRGSLLHAEPVNINIHVNDTYPPSIPRQSTPPALLLNFPALPKQLEYRVNGQDLILLDTGASLVVDIAHNVIP